MSSPGTANAGTVPRDEKESQKTMNALEGQWIDVFRAGDYGDKGSYTPADLDLMVANYNPAQHEAPVVIGHPEHDAPAFGWVAALRRAGDTLQAKLRQVAPQFEALVGQGQFKKRSVAFYRTASGLALRHLGFLGAMPPEVKGLRELQLCEFRDNSGFIAIEAQDFGIDAAGLTIRKLIEEIAAERRLSFEEASEGIIWGLKELLRTDMEAQDASAELKFNLSPGIVLDRHSVKVLERTKALGKENPNLTFEEAMRQAREELGDEAPISTFIN
jgi:hypothetical protein